MKLNEKALERAKQYFIGKRFNLLTVLDFAEIKHGARHWTCRCDCGNLTTVNGTYLKAKSIKSCGCRQKISKQLPHGEAAKNRLLDQYKNNARHRNLVFSLSKEEFLELVIKPCTYCGSVMQSSMKQRISNLNGDFKYTGLDRVDSTLGYMRNNCVPCCVVCNRMKLDLSEAEFIAHVHKVFSHVVKK